MKKNVKDIHNYWDEQAISNQPGELATHKDINQVNLEVNTIIKYLRDSDHLLDIGCGNGYSTFLYHKKCMKTIGIDYSMKMIESARKSYANDNLSFDVGDVLSLNFKNELFTVVNSTRCLINLTSWEDQKKALYNLHSLLVDKGLLILTEGIKQGRDNLNQLREQCELKSMPPVWHNIDFDEEKLFSFLDSLFIVKRDIRFGFYDVMTRVYYPALIKPQEPEYGTEFHRVAEMLQTIFSESMLNKYSRVACLILEKK
ncbi:class I SAM-dependent methyltransferase [candidate division KSB1 bacterium]